MMTVLPAPTNPPTDRPAIAAAPRRSEPADPPGESSFDETLRQRRTPSTGDGRAPDADEEPAVGDSDDAGPPPAADAPADPSGEPDDRSQATDQQPDDDQEPAADAASPAPPNSDASAQQPVKIAQGLPVANVVAVEGAAEPAVEGGPQNTGDSTAPPRADQIDAANVRAVGVEDPAPRPQGRAQPVESPAARDQADSAAAQRLPDGQLAHAAPADDRSDRPAEPVFVPLPRGADAVAKPPIGEPAATTPPATTPPATTPPVEVQAANARPAATDASASGNREDRRPAQRQPDGPRPGAAMAPAAARAMQVETAVQLENLTGQAPGADATARLAGPQPTMMNGLPGPATLNGGGTEAPNNGPPPSSLLNDGDFSSRIVRGLSAMINQRGGVMNMRLHPPELGDLRVQMSITRGTVSAQFTAATEQAHVLLDRSLTVLRAALESHGLTVERLGVQVAPGEQSNAARHEAGGQQNAETEADEHDAAGGESRGRREGDGEERRFGRPAPADFAANLDALDPAGFSLHEASSTRGKPS